MKLQWHCGRAFEAVIEDDVIQFAEQHPLLAELKLSKITNDQAITFVRHLASVKRFKFRMEDRSECDRFLNQLVWQHNDGLQIELTC